MMTEKIGTIKNPLTIIAIFAGIAEVGGTVVLPFLEIENQKIFIWFLMIFPIILILLFFATLNFNSKSLYAPSDFSDEINYIKINKFDASKQEMVQVEIEEKNIYNNLIEEIAELKDDINTQIMSMPNFHSGKYDIPITLETLPMSAKLKESLDALGFTNVSFSGEPFYSIDDSESIWVGENIKDLDGIIKAIRIAKSFYTQLQYIDFTNHILSRNKIYIGGATSTALDKELKKLSDIDFEKIYGAKSIYDIKEIIK